MELTDDRVQVVTADAVVAVGALLVDGALGEERLDRLDVVGNWVGDDLTLDDDQLAGRIEAIAAGGMRRRSALTNGRRSTTTSTNSDWRPTLSVADRSF